MLLQFLPPGLTENLLSATCDLRTDRTIDYRVFKLTHFKGDGPDYIPYLLAEAPMY